MSWIKLKFITIALTTTLTFAATAAYAAPETPQAACERLRLQCQKDWAETNSNGVPVTSPEKTKLCWDIYKRCMGTGNADQSTTPAETPDTKTKTTSISAMKHFEIRYGSEFTIIDDCHVNGSEVTCTGRYEKLPSDFGSYKSTTTGQISGSIITGTTTARTYFPEVGNGCHSDVDTSWQVTMTLQPNHDAIIESGPVNVRSTIGGHAGCARVDTATNPGSKDNAKWRTIE